MYTVRRGKKAQKTENDQHVKLYDLLLNYGNCLLKTTVSSDKPSFDGKFFSLRDIVKVTKWFDLSQYCSDE